MKMGSLRINLIVLRVADLARSETFYRVLGLNFARHAHGSGPEHLVCEINGVVFELYPASSEQPVSSSARIGFEVNDVDALVAQLSSVIGAKIIVAPKDSEWGRRAVVADPDGHRVELTNAPAK
jgi:predicted enzyme related to lactoylglutathione lyase